MKRVLLVNATAYDIEIPEEARRIKSDYFRAKSCIKQRKIRNLDLSLNRNTRSYSIGLLRIATILKQNGCSVVYQDLADLDWQSPEKLTQQVDLVAFGAVTPTVPACARLCRRIKEAAPSVTVAIGGPHINVAKQQTQDRYPCFDIYADGHDITAAAKLLGVSPESMAVPDVYADYSILPYPLSAYILNTFTTLGCTYRCDYCQDHRIPYYENPDITGLLHFLGKVPRGSRIHYFDSTLGVRASRTQAVCEALAQLDHGFLLSCDARAEIITPTLVQLMERAGFTEVCFGMETADENVLRANNRTLSVDRLRKACSIVRQHSNLYISIYNAVGIPGSTPEAAEKSRKMLVDWLLHDEIDEIKTCVYVPYPMDGKNYSDRGLILDRDDWAGFDRQSYPVYHLENMTAEQIWNESLLLLEASVEAWVRKLGFRSIHDLPENYWVEYLTKHNRLNGGA